MHVRGSSLSHPKVVTALQPFIVAFWGQSNDEPTPADVRALEAVVDRRDGASNVRCYVLDVKGKLVHSFNGFPRGERNPSGQRPEAIADYFADEINRGAAKIGIVRSAYKQHPISLPDTKTGVRMFIRLNNMRDAYGVPVVEVIENKGELETLTFPKTPREIPAAALARWLSLCYPAGVNEQLEPFKFVKGTLTLKSVDARTAILSGNIQLAMTEIAEHPFEGQVTAVLTYSGASVSLRGIVDGLYPRQDPYRGWQNLKLTATIESRPQ